MSDSQPKQSHRFWMLKYLVWLFAATLVLLFFVFPFLTNYALHNGYYSTSMSRWLDVIQWLQMVAMHSFVYLWITFLGSCFASFLNVVAWRVPRGRSILGSSHCPHCDAKLSFRDNIPIFGWLNNDGKCRGCVAPIAVRYLIVELLLGVTFLLLFVVEVVLGGQNLPLRPDLQNVGIEFVLFAPNWPLILTFAYHAALMCGLFTIAVIASEHKRIPLLVVCFAAVFLVAIASTWPHVIQVPWTAGIREVGQWPVEGFSRTALYTMAIGAGGGLIAGGIAWGISLAGRAHIVAGAKEQGDGQVDPMPVGSAIIVSFGLVGLALGWQSVVWVLLIWCLCKLIFKRFSLTRLSALLSNGSAVAMFATIVHVTLWRFQMPLNFWLNE